MVAINKAEAEAIRAQFPEVHIVRTMKQKSKRHRYYCEESKLAMRFLNRLRGIDDGYNKRAGGNYNNRKKNKRDIV